MKKVQLVFKKIFGVTKKISNVPAREVVAVRKRLHRISCNPVATERCKQIASLQKKYCFAGPHRFTSREAKRAVSERNSNTSREELSGMQQSVAIQKHHGAPLATSLPCYSPKSFLALPVSDMVQWMERRDAVLVGIAKKAISFLPRDVNSKLFISAGTLLGNVRGGQIIEHDLDFDTTCLLDRDAWDTFWKKEFHSFASKLRGCGLQCFRLGQSWLKVAVLHDGEASGEQSRLSKKWSGACVTRARFPRKSWDKCFSALSLDINILSLARSRVSGRLYAEEKYGDMDMVTYYADEMTVLSTVRFHGLQVQQPDLKVAARLLRQGYGKDWRRPRFKVKQALPRRGHVACTLRLCDVTL